MTTLKEQQQRHQATMDFFKAAREIAEELKRIEAEEREALESDYRSRMVKQVDE